MKFTFTVIASFIAGGFGFVVICILIYKIEGISKQLAFFSFGLGGILGWGMSILWVPYGFIDRQIYSQIFTTIGAFATGYLMSKFGKALDFFVFSDDQKTLNVRRIQYLGFLVSGFILAAAVIVTCRVEWLSLAAQCNPWVYALDDKGEPKLKNHSDTICKDLSLNYPSDFRSLKDVGGTEQK